MSTGRINSSRQQSMKIAFCGLLVALCVVLMLSGGLIPIATYCAPMAAGILLLPVLLEYGKKTAWTAYAAVALITLMLGIDKEAAFFFLFLGYYPIVKWQLDRIRKAPLRVLAKLGVWNISVVLMYAVMAFLLHMDAVVAEFAEMGAVMLVGFALLFDFCMVLYDRLMMPLVFLYANRVRPKLRFLRS